jgi:hypothetical protein
MNKRCVMSNGRKSAMNAGKVKLLIVPCELKEANTFVRHYHRHHGRAIGHKFSIAVIDEDGKIRGVAIVGRPVARMLDDGWTLEVLRVATDGCPNACSALYAAASRATFALGYRKLGTYILNTEPGTSLKAIQWKCLGKAGEGSWNRPSRPRIDKHPLQAKIRWETENPNSIKTVYQPRSLSKIGCHDNNPNAELGM